MCRYKRALTERSEQILLLLVQQVQMTIIKHIHVHAFTSYIFHELGENKGQLFSPFREGGGTVRVCVCVSTLFLFYVDQFNAGVKVRRRDAARVDVT